MKSFILKLNRRSTIITFLIYFVGTSVVTLCFYLLFCNYCLLSAQVLHNVSVDNFAFTPSTLTINAGDTVRWTNNSGAHSVDGTAAIFPTNPVSFGNSIGTNWVYNFVFHTTGEYDYRCDLHFAMGMTGHITVSPGIGIAEEMTSKSTLFHVFPIPAKDVINIFVSDKLLLKEKNISLKIYNITSKEVFKILNYSTNELIINIEDFSKGMYFYQLFINNEIFGSGKLIKE